MIPPTRGGTPMETSTSLLDRLRHSPDEESWRRLNDLYRPLIRRWLLRDPTLEADVEDLTQEILTVVCREVVGFERQRTGSFRKWLRTITAYRLRGYYRRRRVAPYPQGEGPGEGPWDQLADDRSELAQRWDQEHNEDVVRRLLELTAEKFNAKHVSAFRRHVLDQVSAAEVAAELEVTVAVVLNAKSRILKHLREVGRGLLD